MLLTGLILLLLLQQQPARKTEPQEKAAKKPDVVVVDPNAPAGLDQESEPPVEYALNPHQAKKELEVGDYYMKKGSYAAAAGRYQQALKWNPQLDIAYLKLGEALYKRGELQKALEAYQKYLEMSPKGKKARDAQKAITRLQRELKE